VRRYAELGMLSREGIERFAADVRGGRFPAAAESYGGGAPARTAATIPAAAAGGGPAAAPAPAPSPSDIVVQKLYG
jgi:hypothetical protein